MKEELKILKEILDITKLSGIQDPNGKIMSPFDSDNTQEKISLFRAISKLQFSLKVGVTEFLKNQESFINCAPDDTLKYINYLYIQKIFMVINYATEENLIWQIAYLNGLLLQNKPKEETDKNYSSLSTKLEILEIMNCYKKANYLNWHSINEYFLLFDYNLETLACTLLKLHFLKTMKKIEFLKDEWIIGSVMNKTDSKDTIAFMETLIKDLEKSDTIS